MNLDERIERYLAKCPPCVSGSGGDDQLFTVACALEHGFALDETDALRWLSTYNETCRPPWPEHRLRHKVKESARAAHDKPRGHLLGNERAGQSPGRAKGEKRGPKPVPMLSKAPKGDLQTLQTLPSGTRPNARAHTHIRESMARKASEASVPAAPAPPLAIPVPGCATPRPASVDLPDVDWRALESVGMTNEPLVLAALAMFGPGCRVLESEVGE